MSLKTLALRPAPLFLLGVLLRVVLLFYGMYQDAHSALKYTDIDYLVFTDAARLPSPYDRATYRYTPLLAWLLYPTTLPGFFSFGKTLFAVADIVAGYLIWGMLRKRGRAMESCGAFTAIWLWNPMVATISTRGSSEGLLGVLTMALLWAVEQKRISVAGILLGLSVHFKIYPFIYAPAIIWWMDDANLGKAAQGEDIPALARFLNMERVTLAVTSLATFVGLNATMYLISYGHDFLQHTFLHHVTRLDHRHNFSPYNVLLYLSSAEPSSPTGLRVESLAFLPQLLLSCVLIPLVMAKRDLAVSMMAQTFAFVTFNKVCTSQYFLWYMVFLPLYLPHSSMLRNPTLGITALALWILTQAAWLQQGYELEFLGRSTFFPGMWLASLAFFLTNCWILGIIITDGASTRRAPARKAHAE
ncbi:uncharacterized protein J7T54_008381 [Emericellopsis cladophorae]|uniref:GPI mannosyltransferase 1 n=1 Tax=Emericellopsis cladophorae TaxID=2686198 RepID=A0A9P9Y394_9HYPO|nr:uncharacterized protein J7T54_008381 [Emericellopsis cladophorae]KAI6782295.1 hypothetical protein J7T54_008381 [Emericellopsis cladophorae]